MTFKDKWRKIFFFFFSLKCLLEEVGTVLQQLRKFVSMTHPQTPSRSREMLVSV